MPNSPTILDAARRHISAEVTVVCVAALAGAAAMAWRASRQTEADLNARTWARLVPPEPAVNAATSAQGD